MDSQNFVLEMAYPQLQRAQHRIIHFFAPQFLPFYPVDNACSIPWCLPIPVDFSKHLARNTGTRGFREEREKKEKKKRKGRKIKSQIDYKEWRKERL